MGTLHNRGPPAALPGAWNYINSLTAKHKAADQRVSPIRPERVSPIPPVAHAALLLTDNLNLMQWAALIVPGSSRPKRLGVFSQYFCQLVAFVGPQLSSIE